MATRTTTTRTTRAGLAPSADPSGDYTFEDLVAAYLGCRRNKRRSYSAMAFEEQLERNLCTLHDELRAGTYQPGRSICFVITHPKPREVWAADFRDRVVHHLLYNRIAERFHRAFVAGSCACIAGRGTLHAAELLEHYVRSITRNWARPAWYLKCDLANFFVSIDKTVLFERLAQRVREPWWLDLTRRVLFHDPREQVDLRSPPQLLRLVPPHKSLFNAPADTGLPIGNLSSQFFANVLLDALDQRCKHQHRARYYLRYVDDFVVLDTTPQQLNAILADVRAWLPARLHLRLNDRKTILQPVDRGVDFVGHVVKPWRRTTRRKTLAIARHRLEHMPAADVFAAANSYLGLVRQASHGHADLARLANVVRRRGHCVRADLTKTYRTSPGA